MSYRCMICRDHVPSGQAQLRHQVLRANGQIEREIPVCRECWDDLGAGVRLGVMLEEHREARGAAPEAVVERLASPALKSLLGLPVEGARSARKKA